MEIQNKNFNKNTFWGNNYYEHPPLTDKMLKGAEDTLQVKLPILFVELLKVQNGGYTKGFAFPMTERTSWSENHVPLDRLFGIVTETGISTAQNILDSQYMIEEWGLPEKQVLLNGDGHWWITLDYRSSFEPQVMWMDIDNDEEIIVAENFEEFINGLVSEDNYSE